MNPLNPQLHERLGNVLGRVEIGNQGEQHMGRVERNASLEKRWRVVQPGEYYHVNCPFCHDCGKRLWINHTWGVREPETGSRRWFMACCYHNNCLESGGKREGYLRQLKQAVYTRGRLGEIVLPPAPPPPPSEPIALPAGFTPLASLPYTHPAIGYLAQRGFRQEVVASWGAGYCSESTDWRFRDRIVIPVYQDGQLRSWQTRLPYDPAPDGSPKYASGPKVRQWVYGLDQAATASVPFLLVVEGVPSVWRIGPGAVALFGKTASVAQAAAIARIAKVKQVRVVIALDGVSSSGSDTSMQAEAMQRQLLQTGVHTTVMTLPPGTQPDGLVMQGQFWQLLQN